jgi:voltage-gated potassium channel
MKQKLYNIFEKEGSKANLVFEQILVTMIILNVISIALDTIRNLQTEIVYALKVFESFSIVVFSAEYLIRLYLADLTHPAVTGFRSRLRFIFSFFGLIDLLAILPFYLPFVIRADMRFLRILRLIRFFRIFKLSRYNSTLQLIWDVIKEKKSEFIMTFFISFLMLLVSAFLMYYIESPGQPENFRNIFSSLWWAVATLTPLGYGGVEPITAAGKVMSAIVAVIGIGLIALPTGIISAGFIQKIKTMDAIDGKEVKGDETKRTAATVCPHCGKKIEKDT